MKIDNQIERLKEITQELSDINKEFKDKEIFDIYQKEQNKNKISIVNINDPFNGPKIELNDLSERKLMLLIAFFSWTETFNKVIWFNLSNMNYEVHINNKIAKTFNFNEKEELIIYYNNIDNKNYVE